MKHSNLPLETRVFRLKKARLRFLCPLCGTERFLAGTPFLSSKNYFQIFLATCFFVLLFFPLMGVKSFFLFFVFWALVEASIRFVYRKQVPCEYCGFDAVDYKKDVKVARQKVEKFWSDRKKDQVSS